VSTRLIGALVMTHSDDDGLVLPPLIAPTQIVLLPIHRTDEERARVVEACRGLEAALGAVRYGDEPIRVRTDARDMRGGDKVWQHVKQGVPVRVEIGPRDLAAGAVSVSRRNRGPRERVALPLESFPAAAPALLEEIQRGLYDRALAFREARTVRVADRAELVARFADEGATGEGQGGFVLTHVADTPEVAAVCDPLKVTVRCIPMDGPDDPGRCIITGQPVQRPSVLARAY
jgi:prolyl-tRNA synthetase